MKKIMSLAAAILIILGFILLPKSTYAYEYTGGTQPSTPSVTISWDPNGAWNENKEFTNDSSIFTVNSPSANETYVVGEKITLSVTPYKYYNYIFSGGISTNLADNFIMTILKGNTIKKEFEVDYKGDDLEKTFTDSFTPTEEGTYKVNIFFRGSTSSGENFGNYYIQVAKKTDSKTTGAAKTAAKTSTVKTTAGTFTVKNGSATLKTPKSKTLTKLSIPATIKANGKNVPVTAIAPNAFKGMKKLTSVTIGKNVKTIGAKAFYGCKKLKKITIKSTKLTKKTVGAKAFTGINKKAVIKCPKAKKAAYKKFLLKKGMKKTMTFK